MELDLDDLLGRVDLIDRQIARKEREQEARGRAAWVSSQLGFVIDSSFRTARADERK